MAGGGGGGGGGDGGGGGGFLHNRVVTQGMKEEVGGKGIGQDTRRVLVVSAHVKGHAQWAFTAPAFFFFSQLHQACVILPPRLRVEPTSPALEDKVLTTGPPGKSLQA